MPGPVAGRFHAVGRISSAPAAMPEATRMETNNGFGGQMPTTPVSTLSHTSETVFAATRGADGAGPLRGM